MRALVLLILFFCLGALADDKPAKKTQSIDFDAEVIEGINKQPLDTLNQIAEKEKKEQQTHLYNVRSAFDDENDQTIRDLTGLR